MIRIVIIAAIAYCSIGYAIKSPDQASMLHKSASSMVSAVYKKAKSFISELSDDEKQAADIPPQKAVVRL